MSKKPPIERTYRSLKPLEDYTLFKDLLQDILDQTGMTISEICNALADRDLSVEQETLDNWRDGGNVGNKPASAKYLRNLANGLDLHREPALRDRFFDLAWPKKRKGQAPVTMDAVPPNQDEPTEPGSKILESPTGHIHQPPTTSFEVFESSREEEVEDVARSSILTNEEPHTPNSGESPLPSMHQETAANVVEVKATEASDEMTDEDAAPIEGPNDSVPTLPKSSEENQENGPLTAAPPPHVTELAPKADDTRPFTESHAFSRRRATSLALRSLIAVVVLAIIPIGLAFFVAPGAFNQWFAAISNRPPVVSPVSLTALGLPDKLWKEDVSHQYILSEIEAQPWKTIEQAASRREPLATALVCMREGEKALISGEDRSQAIRLCKSAGPEHRAQEMLALLTEPRTLTLDKLGLSRSEWNTLSPRELLPLINSQRQVDMVAKPSPYDELAYDLRCLQAYASEQPPFVKAMRECQSAMEKDAPYAPVVLALMRQDWAQNKQSLALLERAELQGSLVAKAMLGAALQSQPNKHEKSYGLLKQFFEEEPSPLCGELSKLALSAMARALEYGIGVARDPHLALIYYARLANAECFGAENPVALQKTRQLSTEITLSTLDDSSLITFGNKTAPVKAYVINDLSCKTCRNFYRNDFDAINRDYIETGKLYYVIIPSWDGDAAGNNSFLAYFLPSCLPKYDQLGGFLKFFRDNALEKMTASDMQAYMEHSTSEAAAKKCFGNVEAKERLAKFKLNLAKLFTPQMAYIYINGVDVNLLDVLTIRKTIKNYSDSGVIHTTQP